MPTFFYWVLCIAVLLVVDVLLGKRERSKRDDETPKEKRARTVKGVILAVAMVGLACAISYFVRN